MGGCHYPPEDIGAAISRFYAGASLRQIVEEMGEGNMEGNSPPISPDTIGRWVIDYTAYALHLTADLKFSGLRSCYLFSVTSPIRHGRQWWALFACCPMSWYILACHVTTEWNERVAANFVRYVAKSLDLTEFPPVVITGTNRIYESAMHRLGLSLFHFPVPGDADSEEVSVPGGPDGNMMREIQRAFRMKSPERAALHLKGWALSYNHLNGERVQRQNMLLETPIISTVHIPSWTDVVRRSARNQ